MNTGVKCVVKQPTVIMRVSVRVDGSSCVCLTPDVMQAERLIRGEAHAHLSRYAKPSTTHPQWEISTPSRPGGVFTIDHGISGKLLRALRTIRALTDCTLKVLPNVDTPAVTLRMQTC